MLLVLVQMLHQFPISALPLITLWFWRKWRGRHHQRWVHRSVYLQLPRPECNPFGLSCVRVTFIAELVFFNGFHCVVSIFYTELALIYSPLGRSSIESGSLLYVRIGPDSSGFCMILI